MRCNVIRCVMVLGVVLTAATAFAEATASRDYALGQHGSLQLNVPVSWKDSVTQPPNGLPPTIAFVPERGAAFRVLLTPIWSDRSGAVLPVAAEIRKKVEQAASQAKAQAIESDVAVVEMTGTTGLGYHYAVTDRDSKPGEFKRMKQGMLRVGDLLVSFTILSQEASDPVNQQAMVMLERAAHTAGKTGASGTQEHSVRSDALQITSTEQAHVLTVPASRLVMRLPLGGLSLTNSAIGGSTTNPRYFHFRDDAKQVIISGWFESDQAFPGLQKVWADEVTVSKKNGLPDAQRVVFGRLGNWETIAYERAVPNITNSHLHAHWVQAGTWIDLHASLTSNGSSEDARAKLESLLRAIVVKQKTP
ncbi:hypothetical protein [Nitrospira lenta]|uniref:Lipoprotein n=1 Tax=Nitrospira lenta TaxID=1436998 RepID=A0A330L4V1_9BACT|nr:hypothetical protein [Nitrospira lenta]SPP64227.1 exported hypothetical protein [Nitrospira lenta]